jgi:EmrB/QacA subfamily drug resistance transporter
MQAAFTPSEIRIIVTGAMLAMFLSLLDQTIIATALPPIASDLHNFAQISWVVTAYLLASTCVTPIVGKLSDLYGRRITMVVSLAIFIVASALCALSTSMLALILARALQGLGGGGLIALGQTVIAEVVDPRERGRYSAYFSTMYATSSVVGPTLGGVMTQYWGWPFIFWISVPLGLTALLITERVLRKLPVQHQRPSSIDYAGIALLCGATTALLLLVSLGGKKFAWTGHESLALAAATLLLTVLFVRRERSAAEPIFAQRLLRDPLVRRLLIVNFFFFGAYLAVAVLPAIYFQVALGKPSSEAGFLMIPMMLATSIGALFTGRYLRGGRYKPPPLVSLPIAICTMAFMAVYADRVSAPVASFVLMFYGFGIGPVFPVSTVAAQNAVESRDLGALNSTLAFVRALGSALGVAAASALVLGLASNALPPGAGIEDLVRRSLPPDARVIVAKAFGIMFGATGAVLAVSLALFIRIEERRLPTRHDAPRPAE